VQCKAATVTIIVQYCVTSSIFNVVASRQSIDRKMLAVAMTTNQYTDSR
jgi:hypothetical protein